MHARDEMFRMNTANRKGKAKKTRIHIIFREEMLRVTIPNYGGEHNEEDEHDTWALFPNDLDQHPFVPFPVLSAGIGIILEAIVLVLEVGLLGSKLFQLLFVVVIIVDEYAGGDVHRVYLRKLVALHFCILKGWLMFMIKKSWSKYILYNIYYRVYTNRKDFAWEGQ